MPPQTPYGSRTVSACWRHWVITGQLAQIALAASSRRRRAGPRSPSGGKNTAGATRRHAPRDRHPHTPATGRGSREISAMACSSRDCPTLNNVWRDVRTVQSAPAVVQVPVARFFRIRSVTSRGAPDGARHPSGYLTPWGRRSVVGADQRVCWLVPRGWRLRERGGRRSACRAAERTARARRDRRERTLRPGQRRARPGRRAARRGGPREGGGRLPAPGRAGGGPRVAAAALHGLGVRYALGTPLPAAVRRGRVGPGDDGRRPAAGRAAAGGGGAPARHHRRARGRRGPYGAGVDGVGAGRGGRDVRRRRAGADVERRGAAVARLDGGGGARPALLGVRAGRTDGRAP